MDVDELYVGANSDYPLPMGIERKKTDISEWDYRLGRVRTVVHVVCGDLPP